MDKTEEQIYMFYTYYLGEVMEEIKATNRDRECFGDEYFGENKVDKTTEQIVREVGIIETAGEFLDIIQKMVDQHGRDQKIVVSIPFRDNLGLHYENIKNISSHEGLIDIHTTVPENDDNKKAH